jgi:hypothetical protein
MLRGRWLASLTLGGLPRPVAGGALQVLDARSQPVGALVDVRDGLAEVVLEAGGQLGAVKVGRDRFVGDPFPMAAVAYESADCSGPPLLFSFIDTLAPGLGLLTRPTVVGPGNALLIATTDAPVMTPIASLRDPAEIVQACIVVGGPPPQAPVRPTVPFVDLGQFVPPFHLAGPTGGGAAGRSALRVLRVRQDSGDLLGPVVGGGLPLGAIVPWPAGASLVPVTVASSRLFFGNALVAYTSADCTGDPLLISGASTDPHLFATGGVTVGGDLVVASGDPSPLVVGSAANPFLVPPCSLVGPAPPLPALPTAPLLAAASLSLPLRLQLEPAGSEAGRGGGPLTVLDAAGNPVGPAFAGTGHAVTLLLPADRGLAGVLADAAGVTEGSRTAYFSLPDCAGSPVVPLEEPADPAPILSATVMGPGRLIHLADGPLDVASIVSRWDPDPGACAADPRGPSFVRTTRVLLDPAGLPTPFRIR